MTSLPMSFFKGCTSPSDNKEIKDCANGSSRYILVMGSSWIFPARASPSYEGSEPSQAELGHFDFRAETELKIF